MSNNLTVSYSQLKTFSECPRKWKFRYQDRTESVSSNEYMDRGVVFHKFVEAGTTEVIVTSRAISADQRAIVLAAAMGYTRLPYKLQHEVQRTINITDGVDMTWIVDAKGTDSDGKNIIVETKTTTKDITSGSAYWENIHGLNPQADTYFGLERMAGDSPAYCIWDAVKLPSLRRIKATPEHRREYYKRATATANVGAPKPGTYLTDESFEEFVDRVCRTVSQDRDAHYRREVLLPDDAKIADTMEQNIMASQLLVEAIDKQRFTRNTSACGTGMFTCEYLPVCSHQTSLDNDSLYQIRSKRVQPPEVF